MKKFIFTAVLTLAFVAQSYAQSAYFLFDEGAKLTIANTDAKGKHTGYSTLEVKAGHVAVIAQTFKEGRVPDNCVSVGKAMVKDRFGTANVFASVCIMTTSVFS